jgi:hypothetical protein
MTLVIDKDRDQVGTHVLIIGVGHYPNLLDGEGPRFDYHGGMGQLTSPPNSALELANWFATNHRHPEKPLRTLQLLISGTPNTFMPPAGQTIVAEPATLENIRKAVRLWRDYGDLHEENHLVFYFCGHGVSTGIDQSLLSEDFGSDKDDPFQHAVDFWRLHVGMRACKAKWQCYFLDACQTVSQTRLDQFGDKSVGAVIVAGSASSNLQKTEQPVLLACALGAEAYGEKAKASFFAQALLAAFKGAAAQDNGYGEWEINTGQLRGGLNAFLERMVGKEQVARDEKLTIPFSLHVLDNQPIIPVDIYCGDDPDQTEEFAIDCVIGGSVVQSCPGGEKRIWEIDLPPDKYDFLARNITGGPSPPPRKGVTVYPPYIKVKFKCP